MHATRRERMENPRNHIIHAIDRFSSLDEGVGLLPDAPSMKKAIGRWAPFLERWRGQ
jgi:hypothetical protein